MAMKISDIMNKSVHSCALGESLNAAAHIMWSQSVGCVPVVNHGGYVVGLVTDRDVCMGAYTTGKRLSEIPVESAMARCVITCQGHDSLVAAENLMRQHQVQRLPVVDEAGRLIGMLSVADIALHFEPSFEAANRPLGGDAIALTLAARSGRQNPPPHSR